MAYSFTEKKRIRKDFGKSAGVLKVPYLLAMQLDSYRQFLQLGRKDDERAAAGLHGALSSEFPIESYTGTAALEYVDYATGEPPFTVRECAIRVQP